MINKLIKDLAKGESPYNSVLCTVKEVNEPDRTVDAQPVDGGALIFGVRLNALLETSETDKGEFNIPAVNSFILVTLLDNANAYVSGFSVIEKKVGTIGKIAYSFTKDNGIEIKVDTNKAIIIIENDGDIKINSERDVVFNNGTNGGMAITPQLANYLSTLSSKINDIISTFSGHTHVSAVAGSPTTPAGVVSIINSPPNLENSKVKH